MQTGSSFVHTSPIKALPHDPLTSLASHTIRDAFGPVAQLVVDALHGRGPPGTSWTQLTSHLQRTCPPPPRRLGLPQGEQATGPAPLRAALLVLMQHHIVTAQASGECTSGPASTAAAATKNHETKRPAMVYRYHPERACWILRYAKYIEFMKKALDEAAATVVQTLLLAGRLRTTDLVVAAVATCKSTSLASPSNGTAAEGSSEAGKPRKEQQQQANEQIVEALYKLVSQGFIHAVKPLMYYNSTDDDDDAEFEPEPRPTKKIKVDVNVNTDTSDAEDAAVLSCLHGNAHYKSALPVDSVWCVNIAMFHDYLRAYNVGRLVAERFGSRVPSCGSLVTAALKYRAIQQHVTAPREQLAVAASPQLTTFTPNDLIKYLPKAVLQMLEKKVGGRDRNLQKAWEDLSELCTHPVVVRRIGNNSEVFEVATNNLVDYLKERLVHQLVLDRHGEVAARVISILTRHKWLDSEALAEHAMVPAKDIREVLHTLYRSRYVELMPLSSSRQYNPSHAVFLWGINKVRLRQQVVENVATALWHIRLRRQHELEVGKEWVERAQQATDTDENVHESDRVNYQKFCLGLERLDHAALLLDDTLMAMKDY